MTNPVSANLKVMLDSKTFEDLIRSGDRLALAILSQQNSGLLVFLRTPLADPCEQLKNIPTFNVVGNESMLSTVQLSSRSIPIGLRVEDVRTVARKVYGHDPKSQEFDDVVWALVLSILHDVNEVDVFVTNKKAILESRSLLLPRFPGGPPYVVKVEESGLYLDYFLKKND